MASFAEVWNDDHKFKRKQNYFKNTFSHRTPAVASSIISLSVLQPRTSKVFGALTRPQAKLDTLALCLWPLLVS